MKTSTRSQGFICRVITSSLLFAFTGIVNAESLVAIAGGNKVGIFDSGDAFIDIASFKPITGIRAESFFIDMDLRPSNNKIYGLALNFESIGFDIYTIDPFTGASKFIASTSGGQLFNPRSSGTGFSFDPIADRTSAASLKLVNGGSFTYRINVDTGAVTQGARVGPGFAGVAYTHADASMPLVAPANTQIYYINTITQTLAATLFPLNNPAIRTVGRLGVDVEERFLGGFEITRSGNAYASFFNGEQSTLNTINLNTGAATLTGIFNGGVFGLTSAPVSVVPESETYAYLLSGLALIGFIARRRKNNEV